MKSGVLERYRDFLPLTKATPIFTLGEGDTPLVKSNKIAREIGCRELYFKMEGCNPTGSFKDRGMVVAVAKALEAGSTAIVCASTGNTSASAAAYGARCGLSTIVLVPKGNVARGKLVQAIVYGARIVMIDGTFDQALKILRDLDKETSMALVNSVNPHRLEGQKTAAFEICDALGSAPDWLCLPVGNAGNITAYWMGFQQYDGAKGTGVPRLLGAQAAGAAPLVLGHPVEDPETVATAIRIGRPARGEEAILAAENSGGRFVAVSDAEILAMQSRLAAEGIWVEPASAAGAAGLAKEVREGRMDVGGQRVVCVCTGHGLKDPDIIIKQAAPARVMAAELSALEKVLAGG